MRTFLLSAVFTAMVSLTALAAPPSVVLVQYHYFDRVITVTRGAGKTEAITALPFAAKNRAVNAEQLHALFTKLYEEGYSLQNSSTTGTGVGTLEFVTYVFVKP